MGLLARVHHAEKMFAPILDPFDRPAKSTGGEGDKQILRIEFFFDAESAAHIWYDHANALFG